MCSPPRVRHLTQSGSAHEGNLTSLLDQLDGVQELSGVTVVTATNRPDAILCSFSYEFHKLVDGRCYLIGLGADPPWAPQPHLLCQASRPCGAQRDSRDSHACDGQCPGRGHGCHSRSGAQSPSSRTALYICCAYCSLSLSFHRIMLHADQMEGFSGAEISALCQEAAIITMQGDMNAPILRSVLVTCTLTLQTFGVL